MNPKLFLKLTIGCALVGVVLGYMHQAWWLIVPPLAFGAYFFGSVIRSDAYRRQYGGVSVMPSMFVPNVMVTAWNSAIQTAIFFAGWAVSLFVS